MIRETLFELLYQSSNTVYIKKSNYVYIFAAEPENTTITLIPKEVLVGESVAIICDSVGVPEPSYTITHNDSDLITVNNTQKTYMLKNVQWKDAGKYECNAMNKLGSDSAFDVLIVGKSA